jgi:hypothetical protein
VSKSATLRSLVTMSGSITPKRLHVEEVEGDSQIYASSMKRIRLKHFPPSPSDSQHDYQKPRERSYGDHTNDNATQQSVSRYTLPVIDQLQRDGGSPSPFLSSTFLPNTLANSPGTNSSTLPQIPQPSRLGDPRSNCAITSSSHVSHDEKICFGMVCSIMVQIYL